jgi:ubiquinone/menaquinone biosynthesis C-methylase UbiE
VDVSPGMIEYARNHVTDPNVQFHLGDGDRLPVADASVGSVFSTHVFQHFDSAAASVPVFREVARVLKPGGSLMIHLPLYLLPHPVSRLTRFVRLQYSARKKLADTVAAWKRWQLRRKKNVSLMRGTYYDVQWVYGLLSGVGMAEVEFAILVPHADSQLHPLVMARKAGP